jgi:hypothetical protein
MLWKILHIAIETAPQLAPALRTPVVIEPAHPWPWVALGGVLLLITVIALAARRRLPFGSQP